jgi:hypothetical protein
MGSQLRGNVGSLDRAFRVALGLVLLSLIVVGPKTAWGLVGLIPLITGLVGWCPLYALLGISTHPHQQRPAGR